MDPLGIENDDYWMARRLLGEGKVQDAVRLIFAPSTRILALDGLIELHRKFTSGTKCTDVMEFFTFLVSVVHRCVDRETLKWGLKFIDCFLSVIPSLGAELYTQGASLLLLDLFYSTVNDACDLPLVSILNHLLMAMTEPDERFLPLLPRILERLESGNESALVESRMISQLYRLLPQQVTTMVRRQL
jgi:hypothetical protein